jgi:prevent-host-death family protein
MIEMCKRSPMARRIPVTGARASLAEAINRVTYGRERIVLQRRGKDVAALIPMEDLALLERLVEEAEDRLDVEESRRILADPAERPVPYEDVRADLGLAPSRPRARRRSRRAS